MKTTLKQVSEIITGPFGSQLHQSDYKDNGIPVIMPQNISNRTVSEFEIARIDINDYKRLIKYSVQDKDIVYSRRGDVEKHAFIRENDLPMLCGTGCLRVRVHNCSILPEFLSFFLDRPESKKWISSHAIGSNMPNLNTEILGDIPIIYPQLSEQKQIATALSTIEDKIQNNIKINDNLAQMAHMTYMHLFFDKPATGKIGDILIENPKSTIQVGEAKDATGNIPFYTSGDAILRWSESLVDGRNCFLNTGGNAGVKFYVGNAAYSTDTWCITARDNLSDYLYLILDSIRLELNQKFFQGTGLKHLQKQMLKDRPIYIPTEAERDEFNKSIIPWFSMISDNIRESQKLISLRDWLLPMLMNGQVTISD